MMIELDDRFTIPLAPDAAWRVLSDVERVAACMPGVRLETVSGDEIAGSIKAKLGITAATYRGTATIVERDARLHRATINTMAGETRGDGRATGVVVLALTPVDGEDGETEVAVRTSLEVTGTPTRLGEDVVARVAARLTGQFAQRLREELPEFEARSEPGPAEREPGSEFELESVGASAASAAPAAEVSSAAGAAPAAPCPYGRWAAVAVGAAGVAGALVVVIRAIRRSRTARGAGGGS